MSNAESALVDLAPVVRRLSQTDKLRLIQILAGDLTQEERMPALQSGASYPVWTSLDAFDAASVLLRELEADKAASR